MPGRATKAQKAAQKPRGAILHVVVEPADKARWEAAAARDRRTLSAWVRVALDRAAGDVK